MKKAVLASFVAVVLASCDGGSGDGPAEDQQNPFETIETPVEEPEDQPIDTPEPEPEQEPAPAPEPIAPDPVDTCVSTNVGIAFQGLNATLISDPDNAPENLLDGCVDRDHSWSGERGSIVTLDAGSVHQMQGIYLWSTFARMEWLRIESSTDGVEWDVDWHAVATKPESGPVYYPFEEPGSKRFVRVTGHGSDLNAWVNIAEVRWSVTGFNVQGNRVWRAPADYGGFYSYSVDNQLTLVSRSHADVTWLRSGRYCERLAGERLVVIDATGELDQFYQYDSIAGAHVYRTDWDHWDGEINMLTGPSQIWNISDHYFSQIGPLPIGNDEIGCPGFGSGDPEFNVGTTYGDVIGGLVQNPFFNFY